MTKRNEKSRDRRNGAVNLRLMPTEEMDSDIVAMIKPLDPSIQPSAQFRREMRLRLLDLAPESDRSRRAA